MKLWQKESQEDNDIIKKVAEFTIGKDIWLDEKLAIYDIQGSIAHTTMLAEINLIDKEKELPILLEELNNLLSLALENKLKIGEGIEDIHSEIEFRLTEKLGDLGKKIHSGRSRNDQILLDLKLFSRYEVKSLAQHTHKLFKQLITLSEKYQSILMPGYTHMQVAMVSSFGLWFGAYAESLVDDMIQLKAAYKFANKNPLGSGAGYGSSLPLDREMTTKLLEFEYLNYNVVYAQMNRGKLEKTVTTAIAGIASTISKLAMDMCLYMGQNFNFVSFPDQLTTGSSIMPHKKNPDVWELIRAKCNTLQNLPAQINAVLINLPSGYHRDLQAIKELYIPAFEQINSCINMTILMLENIVINENILDNPIYDYLYSVELVNNLAMQGIPFRDAYIQVGKAINNNTFEKPKDLTHTHVGSIGNLCNNEITKMMDEITLGWIR
jgi:argininosuccinate lyase